ncbi:MAG: hypothetical protein FWE19_03105 [Oscillospiraceae bacterium]|nr:hypothetical protein [Oscillospiraceae bacterium]
MKKTLYALVFLTTAVRLVGVVILFARGFSGLPPIVLTLTSLVVLHGMFLLVRRFIFTLHLRHFVQFFVVQTAVFAFNLALTSNTVLLAIDIPEQIVVGSLLDILVGTLCIYYCAKNIRKNKYLQAGQARKA